MIEGRSEAPADDLVGFVRAWLKLIAAGEWDRAFRQIDLPPHSGEPYTPERFRHEVEQDHFAPGTRFARQHPEGIVYSDPDTVAGDGRPQLYEQDDASLYEFEHDLPLNGEWSDLTLGFEFVVAGDQYAVRLDWLHVL